MDDQFKSHQYKEQFRRNIQGDQDKTETVTRESVAIEKRTRNFINGVKFVTTSSSFDPTNLRNIRSLLWSFRESSSVNDHSCSIVEYSHLISLDIDFVNIDYVDQFLNESKTRLPYLTELVVQFDSLKNVTENFTRDATQRNCAKVKRLIVKNLIDFSEDVYRYFPSL
ncbi:unnamed protein product [Rotaria sordida]|uniref:Uncharacterized protein n=1 Tax=Rotaria sordida TaxID=392033 RepID=A0A819CJJ6_9BILA|nr:unnamed protein product [Rotaria sordida]